MAKRFIKLYEQITDWEWFRHPNTLALFIYLLIKANYKDLSFHGKVIRRGQLVSSLPKIATGVGLSIQQTRTALMHLISTGEVTDEANTQYRIITIVKYDDYQTSTGKSTDDQQTINRRFNRQSTDAATPSIEYIEQKEDIEKIEPLTRGRTASRFTPPTKEEIFDFCLDNRLSIDVDRFFDYYTSNGWKVGKNPMKDWQATVRNWARDKKQDPAKSGYAKTVAAQQYTQRDYGDEDADAMKRMLENVEETVQ